MKSVLDKYFDEVPDLTEIEKDAILNTELKTLPKYGTHTITVSEIYNGNLSEQEDTGTVKIAYSLNKNTITMNFRQKKIEAYEDLLLNNAKTAGSDYFSSKYPNQEITISLLYQDWEVNNINEAATKFGESSVQTFLINMGAATEEDIANIAQLEDITGKIILKKGDTLITQGEVSLFKDLEYTLTESGTYTIIGETNDGKTIEKTYEHEMYLTTFRLHINTANDGSGRGGYDVNEDFHALEGETFEHWIERTNPENFEISNGLVYYHWDNGSLGGNMDGRILAFGFSAVIRATDTIIDGQIYPVGLW